MKLIPVPAYMKAARPWARPVTFGPPVDDESGLIGDAECLVDGQTEIGTAIRAYAQLEPGDVEKLAAGGVIEFTMFGDHLHPFGMQVYAPVDAEAAATT